MANPPDPRMRLNFSGVFRFDSNALQVYATPPHYFRSSIYLPVPGTWNREVFVQAGELTASLATARAVFFAAEVYPRHPTRDSILLLDPGSVVELDDYACQLPPPAPIVTVQSRGHVVSLARRTASAQDYDRWIIVALHNAWDESLAQVTHFNVIYEASLELVAQIGIRRLSTGTIASFYGVVLHYLRRRGNWVVELGLSQGYDAGRWRVEVGGSIALIPPSSEFREMSG
ncbi:uncharacterized protein MELLADRAFT_70076 [Melampsora larici-populina 98AG31]|uniref:Uncharacterized protein n=1 Tax=Melampsora larici-populina (strain 98AG31 / pathotype 3-4-7) TaxID=747676 RepID=F4SDH3_MELLP|nr:uncharacterized protein MELLADRAFT_70076 [Melampsora larici-populina 98AG31]EGF97302.1 hypothetical protein MELLADRAFT_70076 [Melampsora larici-populina 98AG31]